MTVASTWPVQRTLKRMKGWVWVSWWKSTCQVKAEGGSVPSSGSVPVPA